jgi:hypothetical protein
VRVGKDANFAQTNGGMQIFIPGKDEDGNEIDEEAVYERAYFVLALEVSIFLWRPSIHTLITVEISLQKREGPREWQDN